MNLILKLDDTSAVPNGQSAPEENNLRKLPILAVLAATEVLKSRMSKATVLFLSFWTNRFIRLLLKLSYQTL